MSAKDRRSTGQNRTDSQAPGGPARSFGRRWSPLPGAGIVTGEVRRGAAQLAGTPRRGRTDRGCAPRRRADLPLRLRGRGAANEDGDAPLRDLSGDRGEMGFYGSKAGLPRHHRGAKGGGELMASIDKRPGGKWRAPYRERPGGPQRTRQFDRKIDASVGSTGSGVTWPGASTSTRGQDELRSRASRAPGSRPRPSMNQRGRPSPHGCGCTSCPPSGSGSCEPSDRRLSRHGCEAGPKPAPPATSG